MKKLNNIYYKISLLVLICACLLPIGIKGTNTYSNNRNNQEKAVGSKMGFSVFSRIPAESIEELLKDANLVVEGTVITEGNPESRNLAFPNKVLEDKFINRYGEDKVFKYDLSSYEIEVEKTLFGKCNSETIILNQFGSPDSDIGETKVKKGEKVLLILKEDNEKENSYFSVDLEDGLFKVLSDNKVVSLSDNKAVARYDNKDLTQLESEIKSILDGK